MVVSGAGYRIELPVCLSYLHVQVKRFLAAGKLIPSPWLMKDMAHGRAELDGAGRGSFVGGT